MDSIVGRRSELDAISRFLHALGDGSATLVMEGEPGIGKTTLMRAAVAAAAERAIPVLACVASASETRLAYAALADLLGEFEEGVLEQLPEPQRHALDAVLLRALPTDAGVDRRAVATATLSVLGRLCEETPVVVAIDDIQWLDAPTAHVIEFCARRLPDGAGLVVARRLGEAAWLSDREMLGAPRQIDVRRLGPLNTGELQQLLAGQPQQLERRALASIEEASGGNPFYALELARAAPAGGAVSPLALPASLEEIVESHVAGLADEVEAILLAVAMLARPTVEVLQEAFGPEMADWLDAAERRGIVVLDGSSVRFAHPLLASGVHARATSGRRREMHRQLSAAVPDLEERARHLALAGLPGAPEALEEAARELDRRGAPDAAAELLELALGLGGRVELRVQTARHHFDAGDVARARTLLEEAIDLLQAGEARARALTLLAELRYKDDSLAVARELLEQAQAEAGANEELQATISLRLGFVLFNSGAIPEGIASIESTAERARLLGEPGLLAQALGGAAFVKFNTGGGVDEEMIATAHDLQRAHPMPSGELSAEALHGFICLWAGRLNEARAALANHVAMHTGRGEEHALAWAYVPRVWVEFAAGDLASATELGSDGSERLRMLRTTIGDAMALTVEAMVDALAGRVEHVRQKSREAVALYGRAGWQFAMSWAVVPLGFAELSAVNHRGAATVLDPFTKVVVANGMLEPTAGSFMLAGDAAEAFVGVGRIMEAEEITALLEERGAAVDRPWAIALGARCRGLLLAHDGDVAAAEQALKRALVTHERLPMPIERARSLLALGRIRRRLRKRLDAKAALEEALEIFETAGSPRWTAQTQAEITGLGLRPTTSDQLTPTEERVARLAASGMTNDQVAATLVVSAKTVEAHLTRAYRKLGIHSRAQLGAIMAKADEP